MSGSDLAVEFGSSSNCIAYRVPEAAKQIGVSEREMWRLIKSEDIASIKLGPHRTSGRVVEHEALVAYLARLKAAQSTT